MGKKIVHAGGAGNGQVAKVCNNMVLGISMIAVSEAFVMAEKLGLSTHAMFDIVSSSSGSCWALFNHCPVPGRSEAHTSELPSLMRISYAVFCLTYKNQSIITYAQEFNHPLAAHMPV